MIREASDTIFGRYLTNRGRRDCDCFIKNEWQPFCSLRFPYGEYRHSHSDISSFGSMKPLEARERGDARR